MRKLIVLVALSLGTFAARAQAPAAATVTKLPGEEKLSVRERAERDFLMPVRRKRAAELARPTASAEQLTTAAPENDALTTYNEAAPDSRAEVVATTRARASRARAVHHVARREHLAEASRATRHSSKSRSAKAKHTSKASKTSKRKASTAKAKHRVEETHRSKKSAAHKASKSSPKAQTTKTKRHTTSAKTKTKAKPAKHKKRR